MWKCPICGQNFIHKNKVHSCNEKTVDDFLRGKSELSIGLYHHFISAYKKLGNFELHPARARIGFARKIRFGYIKYIGRDFVDIALTFEKAYADNLCFYRIGEVSGGKIYQHYLRIMYPDDINEEVLKFMKMAMDYGDRKHLIKKIICYN